MKQGLFSIKTVLIRFVLIFGLVNMVSVHAWADDFKILALGDSLTAGYGLDQNQGFTVQLQQSLNHNFPDRDIKVMNGGVSGDTTKGGLARLNWALVDNPDMVIVELGANDGLRGLDPKLTEKNLDGILQNLKDRGMKVLLTGMLAPPNLGGDYGQEFNAIYPRLAKKHGVALYPFFLEGVAGIADLNQEDGIHPNADGVAIIVERLLPHIKKVMN
ncbi:arylesterase [Terasakiella brassicae]|uniref:Arylesterase n=1 Tax=Terasakiella brassicae TaxID=1634917 RepID=A0A917BRL2_9PROT|nr:arylesterase [Terasakiella brassicae]GGF54133.1 arylesterase [Terasakiella brassicae]